MQEFISNKELTKQVMERMSISIYRDTVGNWDGQLTIGQHHKACDYHRVMKDIYCTEKEQLEFIDELLVLMKQIDFMYKDVN